VQPTSLAATYGRALAWGAAACFDVAEAEICTAVRLFFEDCHPAPIYMLASSAREILTTIATKIGIQSVLHRLMEQR
jgi:hypothetical protein